MALHNNSETIRIALVDNNNTDRKNIKRTLKNSEIPFKLSEFKNAEDLLDAFSESGSEWNLALVDYTLPGMDGLALCRKIRDQDAHFPLILFTGNGSTEIALDAIKLGVDDCLTKDASQGYLNFLALTIPDVIQKHRNLEATRLADLKLKKLEKELEAAKKIEAIGLLAGGIAHDFNNILTSILGYSEILKKIFTDSLSRESKAVDIIYKEAERGSALTKRLLRFTYRGKFNPEPVDVNSLIQEMVEVTDRTITGRIKVLFDFEEDIRPIMAEKSQISQVLNNIILNAIDAMPEGGEIRFKTENFTAQKSLINGKRLIKPGVYVKMSVTDTGIGMTKEIKDKIFEPFFTTKPEGQGTGLGLATVYGIVKNHSGYVFVESEPEKETTFDIYFPATNKKFRAIDANHNLLRGQGCVLVVEDEDTVRNLIEFQLRSLGYRVLSVNSGVKALEVCKDNKEEIDLVLLDMVMPDIAGAETFKELRKINPQIKTLLISGFSSEGNAKQLLKEGANGFLQKPFTLYNLSKAVRDTL